MLKLKSMMNKFVYQYPLLFQIEQNEKCFHFYKI